ncbi:MAG: ATP-binding cassette domain-containing protein, partial [Leptospiraceae bacterium]|nr:ATP-binding cassette domain-containing protein [Leptospiraceae bacterium]
MIEFAFSHTIRGAGRSFSLNVEAKSDSGLLLLTGPSGSGKTTTLQCLAGIQKVDRGHLFLKGKYWFSTGRNKSIRD